MELSTSIINDGGVLVPYLVGAGFHWLFRCLYLKIGGVVRLLRLPSLSQLETVVHQLIAVNPLGEVNGELRLLELHGAVAGLVLRLLVLLAHRSLLLDHLPFHVFNLLLRSLLSALFLLVPRGQVHQLRILSLLLLLPPESLLSLPLGRGSLHPLLRGQARVLPVLLEGGLGHVRVLQLGGGVACQVEVLLLSHLPADVHVLRVLQGEVLELLVAVVRVPFGLGVGVADAGLEGGVERLVLESEFLLVLQVLVVLLQGGGVHGGGVLLHLPLQVLPLPVRLVEGVSGCALRRLRKRCGPGSTFLLGLGSGVDGGAGVDHGSRGGSQVHELVVSSLLCRVPHVIAEVHILLEVSFCHNHLI